MAEKQSDVRVALEWAWREYSNCVVRDNKGIVQSLDITKAQSEYPPGGDQFLDYAVANRVGFNTLIVKVLGADIDDEDEVVLKEKKSIAELTALTERYKKAGQH